MGCSPRWNQRGPKPERDSLCCFWFWDVRVPSVRAREKFLGVKMSLDDRSKERELILQLYGLKFHSHMNELRLDSSSEPAIRNRFLMTSWFPSSETYLRFLTLQKLREKKLCVVVNSQVVVICYNSNRKQILMMCRRSYMDYGRGKGK